MMKTYDLDVRRLPNIAVCTPGCRVVPILRAGFIPWVAASFPSECFMCHLAIDIIKASPVCRMKIGNAGQIVLVGDPTSGLG